MAIQVIPVFHPSSQESGTINGPYSLGQRKVGDVYYDCYGYPAVGKNGGDFQKWTIDAAGNVLARGVSNKYGFASQGAVSVIGTGSGTSHYMCCIPDLCNDVVLYAHFKYELKTNYRKNNSSATGDTSISITGENFVDGNSYFSLRGWRVASWNSNSSGTGTSYAFGALVPSSGLSVYAQWQKVVYNPYFAGGYGGSIPQYTISDSEQVFHVQIPSRTGYHYVAPWFDVYGYDGAAPWIDGSDNIHIPAGTIGDFWIYPVFEANTYTVKFNANGGTGTAPADESFTYGTAKALNANMFSRTGYTFLGWSTNSAATTATYTDRQSVSNLTSTHGATVNLYAIWKLNAYNLVLTVGTGIAAIYYKVNGASSYTSTASTKTVAVNYNTTWAVYATQKSGYTYTATSSSNPRTGTMGTSGASFSATGTANNYTLTLDGDGATTAGTTAVYYTFDTAKYYSNSGHTSQISSITVPTKTGFQFGGYYTSVGGGGTQYINASGAFVNDPYKNIAQNKVLFAKWIANTYKIKISNGYDATAYADVNAAYGTPAEVRAMTTISGGLRAHYRFAGWKVTSGLNTTDAVWGTTSATCTTRLTSSSTTIANGLSGSVYVDKLTTTNGATVTMTAQWERISYTVTVNNSANKERFDLSSSASGSTYANGVLTFTALAGDSYSVVATFKEKSLQMLSWIIPVSVNGYVFSRTNQGSNTFAAFSASHTFGDSESASQTWAISTKSVTVTISNPRASNVPVPTISFGDSDTTGTSVKIVAGTYTGVTFSQWDSLSPSGVTYTDFNNPTVTLSGISQNTSIRAVYQLARMNCRVAMHDKSLTATLDYSSQNWVWVKGASQSSWSHTLADVAYGTSVTYKFEKQTSTTAPDYTFAGWYDVDGNLVSANATYTITSVTSDVSLYAKLSVDVTLVKSIAGSSDVNAKLVLDNVTYDGQSCYTSVVIGDTVQIGLVLGDGAFFVNWYDSSDSQFANPLELAMNDSLFVEDKRSITARIIDQQSVYHVALYARDTTQPTPVISTNVGQLEIFGESVTLISKDQYAQETGTTSLGDGVFAQVRGTQIIGLNAVKVGEISFLRFKRRPLSGGDETVISRSSSVRTVANQSYVYFAEFGSPEPSTIRATLASADDREKGFVEIGSSAIDISGDGVYAEGTFEVGDTARVIAHPLNGWKFVGWYNDASFSGEAESEDAYYDFEAPQDGKTLYAKFEVDDGASLHKWEGSSERMLAKWRSKRYVLNKPSNLTSVRVDADGYPVKRLIVQSFSSPTGEARSTVDFVTDGSRIANQDMRRLPTKRPERYFQVEIQNDAEVDAIFLGTSGGELAV